MVARVSSVTVLLMLCSKVLPLSLEREREIEGRGEGGSVCEEEEVHSKQKEVYSKQKEVYSNEKNAGRHRRPLR